MFLNVSLVQELSHDEVGRSELDVPRLRDRCYITRRHQNTPQQITLLHTLTPPRSLLLSTPHTHTLSQQLTHSLVHTLSPPRSLLLSTPLQH